MSRLSVVAVLLGLVSGCTVEEVAPGSVQTMRVWYGECWGLCVQELSIESGHVNLVGRNWDNTVWGEPSGDLTAEGVAELQSIDLTLRDLALDETYGCPDCNDGGGVTVSRKDFGESSYEVGDPPEELEVLDAFFFDLVGAMSTCTASDLFEPDADCEPIAYPD